MHLPLPLLPLLLLTPPTTACLIYTASFPFSPLSPFTASIIDNSVKTCWLSLSYHEHEKRQELHTQSRGGAGRVVKQEIYLNHDAGEKGRGIGRRSVGRMIRLTEMKSLKEQEQDRERDTIASASSVPHAGSEERSSAQGSKSGGASTETEKTGASEDDHEGEWLPWIFECLDGYSGHVDVGMRSVSYTAHGQDFRFVPGMKEDIFEEVWRYETRLWCKGADADGRDEKGNLLKGGKDDGKGVRQGDMKIEVKKEAERGSN